MTTPIQSPDRPAPLPARPTWNDLEFHPIANIFPLLEEGSPAFQALVEDFKSVGQQEAIVLFQGKILDGRNRFLVCKRLGTEPKFKTYTGTDPIGFVLSANLHRRHLDESQRAMVGANLARFGVGTNQHTQGQGPSIEGAATILNVGHASIERARKVLTKGDPALVLAVEKGNISVSAAAALADQPKEQQQQAAATVKATAKRSATKSTKTPLDRFEDAWDKLDLATQQAFVEAKYGDLAKLMKEVDRKAKLAA